MGSKGDEKFIILKKGFTLLEVIVVVIIISVLVATSLPQLFRVVERSKASEAISHMGTIRRAIERCMLRTSDEDACEDERSVDDGIEWNGINTHFRYTVDVDKISTNYNFIEIQATRTTFDYGDGMSTIRLTQDSTGITLNGTGVFEYIR